MQALMFPVCWVCCFSSRFLTLQCLRAAAFFTVVTRLVQLIRALEISGWVKPGVLDLREQGKHWSECCSGTPRQEFFYRPWFYFITSCPHSLTISDFSTGESPWLSLGCPVAPVGSNFLSVTHNGTDYLECPDRAAFYSELFQEAVQEVKLCYSFHFDRAVMIK